MENGWEEDMKMNQNKRIIYLCWNIIFPTIGIFALSFFISALIILGADTINVYDKIDILIPNFILSNLRVYLFFILLVIGFKFLVIKNNKDKEFMPVNYYGDCHVLWYFFARFIFGYKKTNLQNKPIYLHFYLIKKGWFEFVENDDNYPIKEIEYSIETIEFNNDTKMDSINMIVSDTYPISSNQIPDNLKNKLSIFVKRKNNETGRYFSSNLVEVIEKEFRNLKDKNVPINIFWTTNPKTNKMLISKLFSTAGRDNVVFNVYQQEKDGDRKFLDKYKKFRY